MGETVRTLLRSGRSADRHKMNFVSIAIEISKIMRPGSLKEFNFRSGSSRKRIISFEKDEHPAYDIEKLATLKPAFKEGGSVTAGNSSGINDGAAASLIGE
jgi:acetyl-CoA C-acetyltransferase